MKWRCAQFQWAWGFFGLPPNYSEIVHTQIFQMCYYGNGFTQEGLYKMPIHLRRFYYNLLLNTKKEESDKIEKDSKQSTSKVRIKK
jgi:hypothetical protein